MIDCLIDWVVVLLVCCFSFFNPLLSSHAPPPTPPPSSPPQVPKAPTPLKAMLQRLSFSPFSSASPPLPPVSKGSGPLSMASKLFSLKKTISFNNAEDSGDLHTSNPRPQFEEQDVDQAEDSQEKEKVASKSHQGARRAGKNLRRDVISERAEEENEEEEGQVEDGKKKEKEVESRSTDGACWDGENFNLNCESTEEERMEKKEQQQQQEGQQEEKEEELLYEAESPDEAALVHAAHAYRCTLRGRSADRLLVDLPGVGLLAVQLLHVLPFHSSRRRMSVVVRHPLSGRVVVYTKGADSVIMDLSRAPAG